LSRKAISRRGIWIKKKTLKSQIKSKVTNAPEMETRKGPRRKSGARRKMKELNKFNGIGTKRRVL